MSNPGVLRLFLFGTALQHRTVGSRVHPGLLRLEEKMLYVDPGIAPKGRRQHGRASRHVATGLASGRNNPP